MMEFLTYFNTGLHWPGSGGWLAHWHIISYLVFFSFLRSSHSLPSYFDTHYPGLYLVHFFPRIFTVWFAWLVDGYGLVVFSREWVVGHGLVVFSRNWVSDKSVHV